VAGAKASTDSAGYASFQIPGSQAGIRLLVDAFFDRMGSDARFATIHATRPDDKSISRDKLARFLYRNCAA